jgi:hypothetical protein
VYALSTIKQALAHTGFKFLQNGLRFENVCVVMFIVAERDNINSPAMGENWQGRHSMNHFTVQTVIVGFY